MIAQVAIERHAPSGCAWAKRQFYITQFITTASLYYKARALCYFALASAAGSKDEEHLINSQRPLGLHPSATKFLSFNFLSRIPLVTHPVQFHFSNKIFI